MNDYNIHRLLHLVSEKKKEIPLVSSMAIMIGIWLFVLHVLYYEYSISTILLCLFGNGLLLKEDDMQRPRDFTNLDCQTKKKISSWANMTNSNRF